MSTRIPLDPADLAAALRVTPGAVDLTARPADDTPGCTGARAESTCGQLLAEQV